jgi:transposase-like protein
MARYVDRFNEDSELDLTDLYCPRCGSSSVRILRYPRAGSWMKAIGSARCEGCNVRFSIREVPPPEPAPPEEADW